MNERHWYQNGARPYVTITLTGSHRESFSLVCAHEIRGFYEPHVDGICSCLYYSHINGVFSGHHGWLSASVISFFLAHVKLCS